MIQECSLYEFQCQVTLEHANACLLGVKDFRYADVTSNIMILLSDLQFLLIMFVQKAEESACEEGIREARVKDL